MSSSNFKIRWSPHSTESQRQFLLINAREHEITLYDFKGTSGKRINYELVSKQTKLPYIRCFDWSPRESNVVAVGQSSGEAVALLLVRGIDTSTAQTFPVKHQRPCNSISFNTNYLIATGLDKVRNDFCLNIWDLKHQPTTPTKSAYGVDAKKPYQQFASSEAVSSVKFFDDEPNCLVAGVGYKWLRIYDLREGPASVPGFSVPTRCVHGVFIDTDSNYFASYSDEGTVSVWDKRFAGRAEGECVLSFERTSSIDDRGLLSLRYHPARKGMFGLLSQQGGLKVYEMNTVVGGMNANFLREQMGVESADFKDVASSALDRSPDMLTLKRTYDLSGPITSRTKPADVSQKILTFDWMTPSTTKKTQILAYRQSGDFEVFTLPGAPVCLAFSSKNNLAFTNNNKTYTIDPRPVGNEFNIIHAPPRYFRRTSEMDLLGQAAAGTYEDQTSPPTELPGGNRPRAASLAYSFDWKFDARDTLGGDILITMKRRAEAGYGMKFGPEVDLSDNVDLEDMWDWLKGAEEAACNQGMLAGWFDLSYVGVHTVWTGFLAKSEEYEKARLPKGKFRRDDQRMRELSLSCSEINKRCERDEFRGLVTSRGPQRRLALAICGWDFRNSRLESKLQELENRGEFSKAAGWALFHNDIERCIKALSKGGQALKLVSTAVAGYLASRSMGGSLAGTGNNMWKDLCQTMSTEMDDPYLRAIFAYVSNGDWKDVLDDAGLPIKEKLGIALRFLRDEECGNYISELTERVIADGELTGLPLVGCTDKCLDLLQRYVDRSGDVQTAALVSAFVSPRYFPSERSGHWVSFYRHLLNTWGLFITRARFDVTRAEFSRVDGKPTIALPARQVTLRCPNCDKPVTPASPDWSAAAAATPRPQRPSVAPPRTQLLTQTWNPILCPRCRRPLPKCSICQMHLGVKEYPRMDENGNVDGTMTGKLAGWFSFCARCGHGSHRGCAEGWYKRWGEGAGCAVVECGCKCRQL